MMTISPFRLAFVGGAPNSAVGYAHFVASRMDNLWRLHAGAFSQHSEINSQAGEIYGVNPEKVYLDLTELLAHERDQLDAVVILTPTPFHTDMVMECLEAGIPVICEKALCTSSLQAKKINDLQQQKNSFLAVIYNYSGYPMAREIKRIVQEGVLGKIIHFQAEMPQEGFIRTDNQGNKPIPQDWRLKDNFIPTIHLDLAVHLHELIYYLTGLQPIDVIAHQTSRGWFDVIDNVTCLCRYTNDVDGQLWFSKSAIGHRNGLRLRIYGTQASVEWYQLNPEEVAISFADGRRQILDRASNTQIAQQLRYTRFKAGHPAGFIEALANLYTDIYYALDNYHKTGNQESREVFGIELATEGMLFMEAMVKSYQSRKWEPIS